MNDFRRWNNKTQVWELITGKMPITGLSEEAHKKYNITREEINKDAIKKIDADVIKKTNNKKIPYRNDATKLQEIISVANKEIKQCKAVLDRNWDTIQLTHEDTRELMAFIQAYNTILSIIED